MAKAVHLSELPFRPAHMTPEKYQEEHPESISKDKNVRDAFWLKLAKALHWEVFPTKAQEGSYSEDGQVTWYKDGKISVTYNCIGRHLEENGDKVAIIGIPNDPAKPAIEITYKELDAKVNAFANVLKNQGVKKGDIVTIFLPMIPDIHVAMLACAHIGAVHSVVFSGLSAHALRERINGCDSKIVITANQGLHDKKIIPLKDKVDSALTECPEVGKVIVIKHTDKEDVAMTANRDVWLHDELKKEGVSDKCPAEIMDAEDPFFILYTSGSTGAPKAVLHTIGGCLVGAITTHKLSFDCHENDVHFCTADLGWITGHIYGLYGPLLNGITTIVSEATPTYPDPSRYWKIIQDYGVTTFYTAPTALRALKKAGEKWLEGINLETLRILGSVGEPLDVSTWEWFYKNVGKCRCWISDTWFQTETGAHMIVNIPGAVNKMIPGAAMLAGYGVETVLKDEKGKEIEGAGQGMLFIKQSVPWMCRTLYKNHAKFLEKYIDPETHYFKTGDMCQRNDEGYMTIIGRDDDLIKVSGHRLGGGEIERAVMLHPLIAEAAAVACPDARTGHSIYVFVKLKESAQNDNAPTDKKFDIRALFKAVRKEITACAAPLMIATALMLRQDPCEFERKFYFFENRNEDPKYKALCKELTALVRGEIGDIATIKYVQVIDCDLPKTRSGKVVRRLLRNLLEGHRGAEFGDTSTLLDKSVLDVIPNGMLYGRHTGRPMHIMSSLYHKIVGPA